MGNGIFCKGSNNLCCGTSHYEINNNVFENYADMEIDKNKKIIANIFIPNCQLEISPENSFDKKNSSKIPNPLHVKVNSIKKRKFKSEKRLDKTETFQFTNNMNKHLNNAIKRFTQQNTSLNIELKSGSKALEKNNMKLIFINFSNNFLENLNKLRTSPNSIIEDINIIMKNKKKINGKEFIESEVTKEIIKLEEDNINLEIIKDFLENEESVKSLKLNDNLKIKNNNENIEFSEKILNDIILEKKREIIYEYPKCFFYPVFLKDIKLNIIILLSNYKIREKLFCKDFSEFDVTTFNIKNNRFFAILCFA